MPATDSAYVMGLDLGTGGARAAIVSAEGELAALSRVEFAPRVRAALALPEGWHEQDPADWWLAARAAIQAAVQEFEQAGGRRELLRAICVDGTSGTIVGLDARGEACTPALMYNDGRAGAQARELRELAGAAGDPGAARIGASWSLAKMRWLELHAKPAFRATRHFAHHADVIAARLTGELGLTDASQALKSGYDLHARCWPAWIAPELRARLPRVLEPGLPCARVRDALARECGLPAGIELVSGATDGTAAFLASGATRPGEDNTTLGTTLVFKRLARCDVQDPTGLVYAHRLPDEPSDGPGASGGAHERWLPGAASSVGGEWIRMQHPGADLAVLDRAAAELLPLAELAYPLQRRGERFPFLAPAAQGFCDAPVGQTSRRFAASLQGVAFVERLAYETLDRVTRGPADPAPGGVFATGGGSASDVWLQLRADVTGRSFHRPHCAESAFGSAVLAAANTLHDGLWSALRRMLRVDRSFEANAERRGDYDELYAAFLARLRELGYWKIDRA